MDTPLPEILAQLKSDHARALEWFLEHEGEVGPRPWRNSGRTAVPGISVPLVAQRGIHQPGGWDVALSVTAARSDVYLDGEPARLDDATWIMPYAGHSGADGTGLMSRWNRSLYRNMQRGIPVGVFIPSGRRYENLGLAIVEDYDSNTNTFLLRGPMRYTQPSGTWTGLLPRAGAETELLAEDSDADERRRAWVRYRREQDVFRERIVHAYEGRCAATRSNALPALQAAHIVPYRGRSSQLVSNGLLLRADIHLLYDRHLLSVHPSEFRVVLSEQLKRTDYATLDSRPLILPRARDSQPSGQRLAVHWAVFERAAQLD